MSCFLRGTIIFSSLLLIVRGANCLHLPLFFASVSLSSLHHPEAETVLAFGEKIEFSEADLIELELVPGLGERAAWYLYMYQHQIIKKRCAYPPDQSWKAYTIVPGIGEKTARHLTNYLTLADKHCGMRGIAG